MDPSESPEAKAPHLLTVMDDGDQSICKIKENVIMLLGLTRAGKSTSYNWILNKTLKSVNQNGDIVYITNSKDSATVGPGYTSVTLIPNCFNAVNATIMDMAGFNDKRQHHAVLGVSYMLKTAFETGKKFKFIITITEGGLSSSNGDELMKTLDSFVNLFKINEMTTEVKQQFYSSIGLLVTMADNFGRHGNYLSRAVNFFENKSLKNQNKALIKEILSEIIRKNMFAHFKSAIENQSPQPCQLLQTFNKKGWQYFNLQSAEEGSGKTLINLPFQKDYNSLDDDEKRLFIQRIAVKTNSYKQFSDILKKIVKQAIENFCELQRFDYSEIFSQFTPYLSCHDHYNTQTKTKPKDDSCGSSIAYNFKSLVKVLEMYDLTIKMPERDQFNTESEFMDKIKERYQGILCILRTSFCRNLSQASLFWRIQYIIERGFREFQMLYGIASVYVHDASLNIKNTLESIFERSRQDLIQKFLANLNLNLKRMFFKSLSEAREFQIFLEKYEAEYPDSTRTLRFYNHKIEIKELIVLKLTSSEQMYIKKSANKSDKLNQSKRSESMMVIQQLKDNIFIEALNILISIQQILNVCQENLKFQLEYNEDSSQNIEANKEENNTKRNWFFKYMIEFLMKLTQKSYKGPLSALDVAKFIKSTDLACKVYDSLVIVDEQEFCKLKNTKITDFTLQQIQQHYQTIERKQEALKETINDSAIYHYNWGRPFDAIKLYQKLQTLENNQKKQEIISHRIKEVYIKLSQIPSDLDSAFSRNNTILISDIKQLLDKIKERLNPSVLSQN